MKWREASSIFLNEEDFNRTKSYKIDVRTDILNQKIYFIQWTRILNKESVAKIITIIYILVWRD